MPTLTPIPVAEYDGDIVNSLLVEEIRAFRDNLTADVLEREQEIRGGLIAWLCYFLPELVGERTRALLQECLDDKRGQAVGRWYRLLPLEMAQYGLTRDEAWLNTHKKNLAYGGSMLRYYVMQSLALAAPELYFDDPQLQDAIKLGLSIPYFGAEEGAAMLVVCKGRREPKMECLRAWRQQFRLNKPEMLDELSEGRFVINTFFLSCFFGIQTYGLHRLCNRRAAISVSPASSLFVGSLLEQVETHPLMHGHIEIPKD